MPSSGWEVSIWYGDKPCLRRGTITSAMYLACLTVRFTPCPESTDV